MHSAATEVFYLVNIFNSFTESSSGVSLHRPAKNKYPFIKPRGCCHHHSIPLDFHRPYFHLSIGKYQIFYSNFYPPLSKLSKIYIPYHLYHLFSQINHPVCLVCQLPAMRHHNHRFPVLFTQIHNESKHTLSSFLI